MDENIVNFAILFQFVIILFLIFSVYFCLSNSAATRLYWQYAKNLTSIFIIIEIIVLLKKSAAAKIIFFFAPYHFISILLFIISGMILTRRLSLPSFPLLSSLGRKYNSIAKTSLRRAPLNILLASIFVCAFTYILFKMTSPEISNFFKSRVVEEGEFAIVAEVRIISIIFFCLVAFYEEVVFRLFIQNFLIIIMRKLSLGPTIAILLTAIIFAIGHFGVLASWEIKFFQTFVIGIVLGYMMHRNGMESSFIVHCALNIYALYASQSLLAS